MQHERRRSSSTYYSASSNSHSSPVRAAPLPVSLPPGLAPDAGMDTPRRRPSKAELSASAGSNSSAASRRSRPTSAYVFEGSGAQAAEEDPEQVARRRNSLADFSFNRSTSSSSSQPALPELTMTSPPRNLYASGAVDSPTSNSRSSALYSTSYVHSGQPGHSSASSYSSYGLPKSSTNDSIYSSLSLGEDASTPTPQGHKRSSSSSKGGFLNIMRRKSSAAPAPLDIRPAEKPAAVARGDSFESSGRSSSPSLLQSYYYDNNEQSEAERKGEAMFSRPKSSASIGSSGAGVRRAAGERKEAQEQYAFDPPGQLHTSHGAGSSATTPAPESAAASTARSYQGLGLGLPFSMSAAAGLSSMGSKSPSGSSRQASSSADMYATRLSPHDLPELGSSAGAKLETRRVSTTSATTSEGLSSYHSGGSFSGDDPFDKSVMTASTVAAIPMPLTPGSRERAEWRDSLEGSTSAGLESPVTDRSKLIGLGELATPRWTSSVLEKKWGTDYTHYEEEMPDLGRTSRGVNKSSTRATGKKREDHQDEDEPFDVLASYGATARRVSRSRSKSRSPSQSPDWRRGEFAQPARIPFPTARPTAAAQDGSVYAHASGGLDSFSAQVAGSSPIRRGTDESDYGFGSTLDVYGEAEGESLRDSQIGSTFDALGSSANKSRNRLSFGGMPSASNKAPNQQPAPALRQSSGSDKSPNHHRRRSSTFKTFSHLPPSPSLSQIPTTSASSTPALPSLPFDLTSSTSTPSLVSSPMGQSLSQPGSATPLSASQLSSRPSRHSYHARTVSTSQSASTPSAIAANILRHTRDLELEGVDFDTVAMTDSGTAEALRKLDGLGASTSPKLNRTSSTSQRSRTTSSSDGKSVGTPSIKTTPKEGANKLKRRTRSIGSGQHLLDSMGAGEASDPSGYRELPVPPALSPGSPMVSSSGVPSPRSPMSPAAGALPTTTSPSATNRLSQYGQQQQQSPASQQEQGFGANASPTKRSSVSSTSYGTSTSPGGSRDSTSGTSYSSARIALGKRRNSVSSDVSSTQSGQQESSRAEVREGEAEPVLQIPPVPPLPKDWEAYRPATGPGVPSAYSPAFNPERRPSDTASLAEKNSLLSPHTAELESSSWGYASSSASSPRVDSSTKSPSARKWSISNAFGIHRGSKSPSIKESASHSDLAGDRKRSSESAARARLESSSSIAALAASLPSPSIDSLYDSSPRPAKEGGDGSDNSRSLYGSTAGSSHHLAGGSPGRSRSSLLSPRRTPSGIPFFQRQNSGNSSEVSPALPKEEPQPDEKSGRKSILGLGFLKSSRRDKEKSSLPTSSSFSRRPSAEAQNVPTFDEFGRRGSVVPKSASSSSLLVRKRGKTVSGSQNEPQQQMAQPSGLPPLHMAALPSTRVQRRGSLASSSSMSSISSKAKLSAPPSTGRPTKGAEPLGKVLPTIAGSPAAHTTAHSSASTLPRRGSSSSTSPLPSEYGQSRTPTKIPRFQPPVSQRSMLTSPKLPSSESSNDDVAVGSPAARSARRMSRQGSGTSVPMSPSALSESFSTNLGASMGPSDDFGPRREPGLGLDEKTLSTRRRIDSEVSQIPRTRLASSKVSAPPSTETKPRSNTIMPRSTRRTSLMASDDKKTATSSLKSPVAPRTSTVGLSDSSNVPSTSARRPLTLTKAADPASPRVASDSLGASSSSRSLVSKIGISSRMSKTSSPAGSDSARSAPSPGPEFSEEEVKGDEEMAAYARRLRAKKLAAGMPAAEVHAMFEFPDPTERLPPLSSRDALALYSRYLSPYERDEIKEYDKVFFVGPNCPHKKSTREVSTNNYGFDDDRGDYLINPLDHIRFRYEIVDVLGKGSFGQVLQCRDHATGDMVAVKIIRNKKRFHHQALVEIKVLENLVKWDPDEKHHVIRMIESFTFRGHLCIVTELLSINLYELVKANSFAGFSTVLIRRFTTQILGSLSLLRHHRVVHCDLKPENILLKHPSKSGVKVIDFGSSCFEHEKVYTYIQSRFYRSPEVILGMNYHMAIDMWSLGCILAEMFTGYPIFPGETEQEQLGCIMEVLGVPDKYLVDRSSRKKLFFDSTGAPRPVVNSKGRRRRPATKTLAQVLKCDDELFVDFIAKCLAWDAERRLKPDAAMRHPWLARPRATSVPPAIPPRIGRASVGGSGLSSSASVSSVAIGSPRRKVPSTGGVSSSAAPAAAPSQPPSAASSPMRTRTTSRPPRLGLATQTTPRFSVQS